MNNKEQKVETSTEPAIVGNTLLAAVAHQKIDLIKKYLEPTGLTITELMDRNTFASLCQLLDAYLLETVENPQLTIPRVTSSVLFSRVWAMPNKLTFTIKPIKELVEKYVKENQVIIDPFANESKYGTIRNDLNPEFDTHYHLDALSFLKLMESNSADVVLYDPPYSITQAAQCYKDYGKDKLEQNVANMGYWSNCKNEVARILKPNGIVIICGWNTNGIGLKRGFQMLEILAVPHGGSKNDTLCTVERKLPTLF